MEFKVPELPEGYSFSVSGLLYGVIVITVNGPNRECIDYRMVYVASNMTAGSVKGYVLDAMLSMAYELPALLDRRAREAERLAAIAAMAGDYPPKKTL